MNIKRIIKEEINDMEWMENVKSNQDIAQEIADKTEIKDNRIYTPYRTHSPFLPFPANTLSPSPTTPTSSRFLNYCQEQYGLTEKDSQDVWERYKKIIKDRVGKEAPPINESDDLQWIEDVPNELPKKEKWVIVNDVNADSLEESKLIQNYLFKQGFKWITGRNYYLPQKVYSILANPTAGIFQHNRLGTLTYYSGENPRHIEEADEVIEEFKSQGKGVYYWSDIKPNVIMESNDMDWISDVKSNQDIAQEIADKTEIKDNRIYTPYHSSFYVVRPTTQLGVRLSYFDILAGTPTSYRFLNYCKEQYGLTEKDSQNVWDRYKKIIKDRI